MEYHSSSPLMDLAGSFLPRHGARLLVLAFALAATGASIAFLSHGLAADTPATATAPAARVESAPIVLPTVVVHAEPEIPTLATVTVRAGDAASADRPALTPRFEPVHAITSFASAGSAGAGFGMPYYSFGKPLRHGTEE